MGCGTSRNPPLSAPQDRPKTDCTSAQPKRDGAAGNVSSQSVSPKMEPSTAQPENCEITGKKSSRSLAESDIYAELWELDENRLTPGKHYSINLQGGIKKGEGGDHAAEQLITILDDKVLDRPTYSTFIRLLNNYESGTGEAEVVTPEEEQENKEFIDACMETKVMKKAFQYLSAKGKVYDNEQSFKKQLLSLWFKIYRRSHKTSVLDSSGFEHVFVGETRKRKVIGFHNWIQFYLQEKAGHIDYQGYILGKKAEDELQAHLLTIKFQWKDQVKPIGSLFIGTSPEFELAIYTILFFCASETHTGVHMANQDITLVCYKHGEDDRLGACYPMLPKD